MKTILSFFICWLAVVGAAASGQYKFRLIDVVDGLSDNQIRGLTMVPDGRIGIRTASILNIYDGASFEYFPYDKDRKYVWAYARPPREYYDGEGRVWMKELRYLLLLDLKTNRFDYDIQEELAAMEAEMAEIIPEGLSKVKVTLLSRYHGRPAVGFVDGSDGRAYYLLQGQTFEDFTCEEVDLESGTVTLARSGITAELPLWINPVTTNCADVLSYGQPGGVPATLPTKTDWEQQRDKEQAEAARAELMARRQKAREEMKERRRRHAEEMAALSRRLSSAVRIRIRFPSSRTPISTRYSECSRVSFFISS